jgi:hypothetical protein
MLTCNSTLERRVKPIGLTRKNANVETLRARYEELLRLRGYFQRFEGPGQDTAEPKERKARAAIGKQDECEGARRVGSAFRH